MSTTLHGSVAAVVVTRNRSALLRRCLEALQRQTRRPDRVLVIDNASTDGTAAILDAFVAAEPAWVSRCRLERNSGGAGGFAHGTALAFREGHDWCWLMDDDCIPEPEALAALLDGYDSFPAERKPVLLASRVEWTDGHLHPMNLVAVKQRFAHEELWLAASRGMLSIRSATFVSLLVARRAIDRYGLPLPAYFLWNDDVEFTARILRHEFGVAVPASRVLHATDRRYGTHDAAPARYFFYVRNQLFMLLWSRSHDRMEKIYIAQMLTLNCLGYWGRRWLNPVVAWYYAKAVCQAITHRPKPLHPDSWTGP